MYVILLGAAALVTTWLVARELNTADAISQTFDAVFHLNAVRWILDTGNASSLSFDMVISRARSTPWAGTPSWR